MHRTPPQYSKWAERRSTVVYAIRSATFGSWKMLTLGAEYSSWSSSPSSPDKEKPPRCDIAEGTVDWQVQEAEPLTLVQEQDFAAELGSPRSLADVHEAYKQDIGDISKLWSERYDRTS
ncbi:hypothetical protein JZ751_028907 [Albula glossodonta]|uniref:Uncharacterized protein n=1 Tax=Albula glossodonta TaxID=121402 RepID=A0A8T2NAJ1_9TELE|nr:hypothetical protein JZ751_028907 [Albula glossodonta]